MANLERFVAKHLVHGKHRGKHRGIHRGKHRGNWEVTLLPRMSIVVWYGSDDCGLQSALREPSQPVPYTDDLKYRRQATMKPRRRAAFGDFLCTEEQMSWPRRTRTRGSS